jgi:antirestriction protein ArdC
MKNEDIRQDIAKKIADAMAASQPPWRQPWGNSANGEPSVPMMLPRNFLTGKRYTGINPLIIMGSSYVHGFASPHWGTMNQWATIGGYVKPRPADVLEGNWRTNIVFYTTFEKDKEIPNGEQPAIPTEDGKKDRFMVLRHYGVFNADQIAPPDVEMVLKASEKVQKELIKKVLGVTKKMTRAIAEQIHQTVATKLAAFQVIKDKTDPFDGSKEFIRAEALLESVGAKFKYGGNRAFYRSPPADFIQLPHKKSFDSTQDFYETAYHEIIHWSIPRLNHKSAFDDQKKRYAFEELVAEIGACFLAAETGLPLQSNMLPRSQSYVQHWLGHIGNDPQYIFRAATLANFAVSYILGLTLKK